MADLESIRWVDSAGQPLTCLEKLKVLSENLTELQGLAQDVLEEAILLQVHEPQIRAVLAQLIGELKNPYV